MNFEEIKNKIRKVAKDKGVKVQEMYDKYFFDQFLKRLSISKHNKSFVLKGGFLLENVIGIKNRTTLDIDFSYQKKIINKEILKEEISEIIKIDLDDETLFDIYDITEIQEEDKYSGYRVRIKAQLKNINKIFKIDIASGDIITPNALSYKYESSITGESFDLLSYNLETILAEKFQTIVEKGTNNSRMKDFYDIYLLVNEDNLNFEILHDALINTFIKRGTNYEKEYVNLKINEVITSKLMEEMYNSFKDKSNYLVVATFNDVINAINKVYEAIQYKDIFKLKTKNIYFIRHGEDEQDKMGGWSNNNLTQNGIMEVEKLKEELNNLIEDDKFVVASSDLKRASETTKILFGGRKIDFSLDLRECNNGILKDLTKEQFIKKYSHLYFSNLNYEESYPEGESPKQFYERVVEYTKELNAKYQNQNVVIVSHQGVYGILKSLVEGIKWTNKIKFNIDYAELKII